MHIKEGSWHWRIYSWITSTDYEELDWLASRGRPVDGCKYLRAISVAFLMAFVLATVAAFVLFCVGAFWYDIAHYGIAFLSNKHPTGIMAFGFCGMIMQFIGAFAGVVYLVSKCMRILHARYWNRAGNSTKEPGVVSTWYRAHKDQFCPRVTYDKLETSADNSY